MKLKMFSEKARSKIFKRFVGFALRLGYLPPNPFGKKPLETRDLYLALFEKARSDVFPKIQAFEHSHGYQLPKDWLDQLALHTQVVIKASDLNWQHGRVLYSALRYYLNSNDVGGGPVSVLETGTARGFSAVCMAKALVDAGAPGTVTTIDLLPHNRPMLWNCIDDFDGPKTREDLLGYWPRELARIIFIQGQTGAGVVKIGLKRVNFAFLDAGHSFRDVIAEYNFVKQRQLKGDVIVFDDVTSGAQTEVRRALDFVRVQGKYQIDEVGDINQRAYAVATRL